MNTTSLSGKPLLTLAIAGTLAWFATGCDTGTGALSDEEAVTVSGRVTDSENMSESRDKAEQPLQMQSRTGVEGAVVTAVAVHADGTLSELDGEATTDADGEFTLTAEGEGATGKVRVFANGDGDFESSAIVSVNGESSVDARPMTAESHAEAEIYLKAKAEDGFDSFNEGVSAADVSVLVNPDVAVEVNAGAQSAADLGAAIANAVKAQVAFNGKSEAGIDMAAVNVEKSETYARLQSDLAAAADAEARTRALEVFEVHYLNVFVEAGADAQTQAKFHQTGLGMLVAAGNQANGNAELGLRKQAELILGQATAIAIEAEFEANGASESTLEALAEARAELVADIRAATSVEEILEAKSEYKEKVDAETEAEFGISAEVRASAEAEVETQLNALANALAQLSIFLSGIAEATAEAFADFYMDAHANAKSSLEESGLAEAEAEAAAEITVMATIMK